MTLHKLQLICLSFATLLPNLALAEEPREVTDSLRYTFEDTLVGASGRSSDLALLHVRTRKARESLVRVREHFVPELCKSVEDI